MAYISRKAMGHMLLLYSCCLSKISHPIFKGHSAVVKPNIAKDAGDPDKLHISTHNETWKLSCWQLRHCTVELGSNLSIDNPYIGDISDMDHTSKDVHDKPHKYEKQPPDMEQYGETFRCSTLGPPCLCQALGGTDIGNKVQCLPWVLWGAVPEIGGAQICKNSTGWCWNHLICLTYADSCICTYMEDVMCLQRFEPSCNCVHECDTAVYQKYMPTGWTVDKYSAVMSATREYVKSQAASSGATREQPDIYNPASYGNLEEAKMLLALNGDPRVDVLAVHIECFGRRYVFKHKEHARELIRELHQLRHHNLTAYHDPKSAIHVMSRICISNIACDDGTTLKSIGATAQNHQAAKEILAVMKTTATMIYSAAKKRFSEESENMIYECKANGEIDSAQSIAMQLLEIQGLDIVEMRKFHQWWANVAPNMSCDFEAFRILSRGDITKNQQPLAQPPINIKHPSDGRSIFGSATPKEAPPTLPRHKTEQKAGSHKRGQTPKTRFCHRWSRNGDCPRGASCYHAASHTQANIGRVPTLEDEEMLGEADDHWS